MVQGIHGNVGQVIHLSNDIDSTVTDWFKRRSGGGGGERHVPPLRAMEEVLFGSIWYIVSPLLTTDDAVTSRTVNSGWKIGNNPITAKSSGIMTRTAIA